MVSIRSTFMLCFILFLSLFCGLYFYPRVSIPQHMLGNPSVFMENLLTPLQGDILMSLAKDMKEFPANVADLKVK